MSMQGMRIVRGWLDDLSFSAATWNLDAHMRLVSQEVEVTGIPKVSRIDYHGWRIRRQNEFDKKLLQSLTYRLYKILLEEDKRIVFTVEETMKSCHGQTIVIDKAVTLCKEDDGVWRVHRERFDRIQMKRG